MTDVAVREPLALLVSLESEGKATTTSLVLPDGLDFDSYEALGRYLGTLRDATAWWIGDWLLHGEGLYGEKYAQAIEATGRSKATLQNYLWVATSIGRSRRRENLSWSHHREIAPFPVPEQNEWLKRCAREKLSVEELRGLLRESKPIEAKVAHEPVAISRSAIAGLASAIERGDFRHAVQSEDQAQEVYAAVDVLRAAAKANGRVAVVVADGDPCPTCGGTGRADG